MNGAHENPACQAVNYRLMNFVNTLVLSKENEFPLKFAVYYLKNHRIEDILQISNAQVFCNYLIDVLESLICENAAVFTGIINLITILLLSEDTSIYEHFFRCSKEDHLTVTIFYMSNNRKENVFPDRECIQVMNALYSGNQRLMQILATYGWCGIISDDSFFAREKAAYIARKFMSIFGAILSRPEIPNIYSSIEKLSRGQYLTFIALERIGADPLWRPAKFSFKRLFLLILGIRILIMKMEGNLKLISYIKSLDIYFKTVSEPYLTTIEVRSLLIDFFIEYKIQHRLSEWCMNFQDLPFCAQNYEPRTLCHLARCSARQNMSKGKSTLPTVLGKMKIPKDIKEFLLCKSSEES